jgi:hypothetical protein
MNAAILQQPAADDRGLDPGGLDTPGARPATRFPAQRAAQPIQYLRRPQETAASTGFICEVSRACKKRRPRSTLPGLRGGLRPVPEPERTFHLARHGLLLTGRSALPNRLRWGTHAENRGRDS